jgi:hypothetical protein
VFAKFKPHGETANLENDYGTMLLSEITELAVYHLGVNVSHSFVCIVIVRRNTIIANRFFYDILFQTLKNNSLKMYSQI